jgi:hypothetical protein
VIENETNSFFNRDFEQQKQSFRMDENLVALYAGKNNVGEYVGWESIEEAYNNIYDQSPDPTNKKITFDNYRIKVFPESAMAIYDQVEHADNGDQQVTKSVRFLEKVNGEWKISFYSWIDEFSYE